MVASTSADNHSAGFVSPQDTIPANHTRAPAAANEKAVELLDAQCRVLNLIAGDGELKPTLEAIAHAIEEVAATVSCFVCWRFSADQPVQFVASERLPCSAAATLQELALGGLDFLQSSAKAALKPLNIDLLSSKPILGNRGEELGVIFALGEGNIAVFESKAREAITAMAILAGFALLSEQRTRALSEANERFAALAKNIPGVVYQRIVTADGHIRYSYISDAAEDLFGVTPEEILNNPQALFDCHGPEYYATFRDRLIHASKTLELWDVEATIYTREGKRKFTHAIARPHREPDGSVVWNGVILDQTRIKEAEIAAAAAEASTRDAIIESIPQAFALFDKNDELVTWNSRFIKLYPELQGQISAGTPYADFVKAEINSGIDQVPEESDSQAYFYQRLARHHLANYTAERQVSHGRWILINEHRTTEGGTVVLHTDVTDLKDREFALEQSKKELEAFASIASHDLQEPLRKIDAFGGRLKSKYHAELGEDGQMYVDRMQSSVARMRELINDLLDYSRVSTQAIPMTPLSMSAILEDVIGDLQILIEATEGEIRYGELPEIDADKTQLRQLLQNIIANALKFHRPGVPPVVEIEYREGKKRWYEHRFTHNQGQWNWVRYEICGSYFRHIPAAARAERI